MKRRVLFVINQLFKGGAETALVNLLAHLSPQKYDIDLLIFDQIDLPDTISLIPQIPDYVNVINVAENEKRMAFVKKAAHKLYRKLTNRQVFRAAAIKYAETHEYDVAISFGEWFSCDLVATRVRASRKYIWIHADMDKASFVHPDILRLYQHFDKFIFVSEHSKQSAIERYPFVKNRAAVVHNLVNEDEVLAKSRDSIKATLADKSLPVLLTVANIRSEKNHLRQVEVMSRLKAEGIRFRWLNIGSLANFEQVSLLRKAIALTGLEADFLLLGASDNPYAYMSMADAVCVLSDHESWSLVITEAKALGVPVIATKTSGALEQIEHEQTGILCGFSVEDIAEKIKSFLLTPELQSKIRSNLKESSGTRNVVGQLETLLNDSRKKLLYVFDNINYMSGARNAALEQLKYLNRYADVSIFSAETCRDSSVSDRYRVIDLDSNVAFRCLSMPFCEVMAGDFGKRVKLLRLLYAVLARLGKDAWLYDRLLDKQLAALMEGFDTVCVLSEASKFRSFVAKLRRPRKVQWIHTDYAAWREQSDWTRAITKHDREIYAKYDTIVCLTEGLKAKFNGCYPELALKTVAIRNLIPYEKIIDRASEPCEVEVDPERFNIVTIGRMEQEKRYDRLLNIAGELKAQGLNFRWYFAGGGKLLEQMRTRCAEAALENHVVFTGEIKNPYPLLKRCRLFVLYSDYEGTPMTIDEAKVLGVRILASDVGGIREQLVNGRFGTVADDNISSAILDEVCCHKKVESSFSLREWEKDDVDIKSQLERLFD